MAMVVGGYCLLAAYEGEPEAQAWLGPKVSGQLALCCIHHMNRLNSRSSRVMMTAL